MVEWNKSKISIRFNAEAVDNRTMSLLITCNDKSWKFLPLPGGDTIWSADICLPTTLRLMFGGKTQTDTKVDSYGNIISDMKVTIENISLDGINCWEWWTEHSTILELDDSDEILLGKSICSNGRVDLRFDHDHAFFWLASSKLE
jgi:hypothetical protein